MVTIEELKKLIEDYEFLSERGHDCPLCGHGHYAGGGAGADDVERFAKYLWAKLPTEQPWRDTQDIDLS